jgi:hypothetical protein
LEDLAYLVDDPSGTPASVKATLTRLLGLAATGMCQGRLTLEAGVPVTTSDQAAQSDLHFTPYLGNRVGLYDGTRWRLYTFSELDLTLSGLTSGKNYDVFLYDNAGALTLELSAAWTNDTTRADALTLQDGVSVKSGATTRRWLGTIRTTGTTTTEDSATKRFVWNAYNRVTRRLLNASTASHSYNGSYRYWNNDAANQIEFVLGEAGQAIVATVSGEQTPAGAGLYAIIAVNIDTTATFTAYAYVTYSAPSGLGVPYAFQPSLGYHFIPALQSTASTGAASWTSYNLSAVLMG